MYGDVPPGSVKGRQHFRARVQQIAAATALAAAIAGISSCTGPEQPPTNGGPPISVEVNQSREQYGKQAILLQLTNTTVGPLAVEEARVSTPLFRGELRWRAAARAVQLPPGQPKSLPAQLPAPECADVSASAAGASVSVLFTGPGPSSAQELTLGAGDPFDVLGRNNAELCLAAGAAAVADVALDSSLEVARIPPPPSSAWLLLQKPAWRGRLSPWCWITSKGQRSWLRYPGIPGLRASALSRAARPLNGVCGSGPRGAIRTPWRRTRWARCFPSTFRLTDVEGS
ncbi:hypothetical protein [Pseudarthrobacter siccitolerans]